MVEVTKVLGLDIGVSSVGWGVIDIDNKSILDCGVRLFSAAVAENNSDRRTLRGTRRVKRRKKQRLSDLKVLFEEYDIIREDLPSCNPYELRVKGLSNALTTGELYAVLYHLQKYRGVSFLTDEMLEEVHLDSEIENSTELVENIKLTKQYHPCEIQWERYCKYGCCRGVFTINDGDEKRTVSNTFPIQSYKKEAIAIITEQMKHYPQLNDDFLSEYINLLLRQRPFYVGPGNEKSRTDYGIYQTNGETLTHLYASKIGNCSLYPDEQRVSVFSKEAQLYNWLNDVNNLTINGEKISFEEKQQVYHELMNSSVSIGVKTFLKTVAKMKGVSVDSIQGYRLTKADEPEMHLLPLWSGLNRAIRKEFHVDIEDVLSQETLQELDYVCTLNVSDLPSLKSALSQLCEVPVEWHQTLIQFISANKGTIKKWHGFSRKALIELIPQLWETSDNQMQIITRKGLGGSNSESRYKGKVLSADLLVDEIYNPVVQRSVRETVKIVNAIMQKYGVMDRIVVEMARDQNAPLTKKALEIQQQDAYKQKVKNRTTAAIEYPFDVEAYRNDKNLDMKIQLWAQQEKTCLYSGKRIFIKDLIESPHLFEVDHIIPKSISFDNSLNNKVLCYATENQLKGQRSPYGYLVESLGKEAYLSYKNRVLSLCAPSKIKHKSTNKLSLSKKNLLLCEEDLSAYEVKLSFKNRHLNDTRYSTRVVLNGLQSFVEANQHKTKIKTIRGKFTSQLRHYWKLPKDREANSSHHAMDALLVAATPYLHLFKEYPNLESEENVFTNTISSKNYDDLLIKPIYPEFISQISAAVCSCKYSHKIDSKVNRKLSDATIYSTRSCFKKEKNEYTYTSSEIMSEDYVVNKIKNIYNDKNSGSITVAEQILKCPSKFLMYHHDRATFDSILEAIEMYKDKKNPLKYYYEKHGPILKHPHSKKPTPVINLKYLDACFNEGIKLDSNSNERKVVLRQGVPWRTDIYYDCENERYLAVGIKGFHLRFLPGGEYGIQAETYHKLLLKEKVEITFEEVELLLSKNETSRYKFCFSLYKNSVLEWETNQGERVRSRHHSRNYSSNNCLELKPIDSTSFPKQKMATIRKDFKNLKKINVDILGYEHSACREKLKLSVKI